MKMGKTRYDWVPGHDGVLLAPEGSKSVRQTVVVAALGRDAFLKIFFDEGRLCGQALEDAKQKYGKRNNSD